MSDELSLYPMTVNTCFFLIYRGSIDKKANITEWAESMNECECATHKTTKSHIKKLNNISNQWNENQNNEEQF